MATELTRQDIDRTRAQADQVRAQWTRGDTPCIPVTLDLLEQLLTAAERGLSVARMMEIATAQGIKWTPEDHFAVTESLAQKLAAASTALREVDGCFEAAYIEGLADRLVELPDGDPGSLKDLFVRRLLPARDAAQRSGT